MSNLAKTTNKSSSLSLADQKAAIFSINGNNGSLSSYKLPQGIVSVDAMIPDPVKAVIAAQFKAVGLNFDVSKIALNQDNRGLLQQLKVTVDMIKNNAKLLPAFAKELKAAMKAAKDMANFNADIVKASLKQQIQIDEAQTDILLAMAGYTAKRNRLDMKLEHKIKRLQKQEEARALKYQNSWGAEAAYIDSHFEDLTDIAVKRYDSKKVISESNSNRENKNTKWLEEAHTGNN